MRENYSDIFRHEKFREKEEREREKKSVIMAETIALTRM
jgi:hypothetical protein